MLVRESLKALGDQLPAADFVRAHCSAIANVAAIRLLQPVSSGDQRISLADGTTLKVSRTHRGNLLKALGRRR